MEQREFSVEEIVHATQAYEKEVAGQNKRCLLKTVFFFHWDFCNICLFTLF